jgi:hypothetical protein
LKMQHFLTADEKAQAALLEEVLRLEPVVCALSRCGAISIRKRNRPGPHPCWCAGEGGRPRRKRRSGDHWCLSIQRQYRSRCAQEQGLGQSHELRRRAESLSRHRRPSHCRKLRSFLTGSCDTQHPVAAATDRRMEFVDLKLRACFGARSYPRRESSRTNDPVLRSVPGINVFRGFPFPLRRHLRWTVLAGHATGAELFALQIFFREIWLSAVDRFVWHWRSPALGGSGYGVRTTLMQPSFLSRKVS